MAKPHFTPITPYNPNVTVDQRSLRWVIEKLQTLEAYGGNLGDDWLGLEDVRSSLTGASVNRAKVVSRAIDTLQELKGITKVLRETKFNIDHNISKFQSAAMPIIRQHGLTSLPQEILAHIRLLLHTNCDKDPETRASPKCPLQLVSRQFRHLELSIPQLWSHIDVGKMKADRIHLQLERSGALGMSLDLSVVRYPIRWREFCVCDRLSIITQHSLRWTHCALSVFDVAPLPGGRGEDHACFATLNNLALPSLKHLSAYFVANSAVDIIRTWSLPNLQELLTHGHEGVLPFLQRTTALDTLGWYFKGVEFPGEHLLETLTHASLSHLRRLDLHWCNTVLEGHGFNQTTQAVQLPSLSEFSLTVPGLEDEPDHILQLLQPILMPNLTKLYARCHKSVYDVGEFLPWLEGLKNPTLRKVTVVIVGSTDQYWKRIRRNIRKALLPDKHPKKLKLVVLFEDEPDEESEESSDLSSDSSDA